MKFSSFSPSLTSVPRSFVLHCLKLSFSETMGNRMLYVLKVVSYFWHCTKNCFGVVSVRCMEAKMQWGIFVPLHLYTLRGEHVLWRNRICLANRIVRSVLLHAEHDWKRISVAVLPYEWVGHTSEICLVNILRRKHGAAYSGSYS